ncbi:hypothetical protein L7F22_031780 [Adiantum nelumboides]|nr:hypothetical protein [Adiantum nelumboides]
MDSLTQLVDVLAENPHLAKERLGWIHDQVSFHGDDFHLLSITTSQLQGVLAIARFLSRCKNLQGGSDLLDVLLSFLQAVPSLSRLSSFPEWFTFDAATVFFSELGSYLGKIVELGFANNSAISAAVCSVIQILVLQESRVQITEAGRALLTALSHVCPRLSVSDIDQVGRCLLDHYILKTESELLRQSESLINGAKEAPLKRTVVTSGEKVTSGMSASISNEDKVFNLARKLEDSSIDDESRSSTSSSAPLAAKLASPSKFDEEGTVWLSAVAVNGSIADCNGAANTTITHISDGGALLHLSAFHDEDLFGLQKQGVAFRLFANIFNMAESGFLSEDHVMLQLRTAASTQLKTLPLILKKKRELLSDGHTMLKISMKFQVCQAASSVYTRSFQFFKPESKGHKNRLRETLGCLIEAANACAMSSCRRLRACEDLFSCLLLNVASISYFCRGQDLTTLFSWLKNLVMATCAQVDPWSNSSCLQTIVKASHRIIELGWTTDRAAIESFLLSLSGSVRESTELEEKERHAVATMQLNIVRYLAELVVLIGKPEVAEIISPLLIENLEEGVASAPSRLRLKLLDAVARIATIGSEKSYREAVILLTRSYLDKLSSVGSTQSRTLAPEATTERVETLPGAFLTIASDLSRANLRADYRLRLLQLCSDVGLAAESKSGTSGAELLGPLLPAVAEICSNFEFSENVSSFILKLFRNLWFYIALFGLAPPIQDVHLAHKGTSSSLPSIGSTNAVTLQAVAGPYLWNFQWSAAVILITQGTPPLAASSLKWVEDELELNELHNPGSRRGSGNEKAASSQRAALYAALKDYVDASSLSTISGVKATFLLAVAFLEVHRLNCNGGILKSKTTGEKRSALSCVFEYLEKLNLPLSIHLCLMAIVHRAFDTFLAWLDKGLAVNGVVVVEDDTAIVIHTCFLLSKLTHRDERVCDLACKFLNQMKFKYPQVLWNPSCLDCLFGLVQTHPQPSLDPLRVSSMQSLIKTQIRMWITQSIALAPCTTQGLLQERIRFADSWLKGSYASDLLPVLSDIKLEPASTAGFGIGILPVTVPAVFAAAAAATGAREHLTELGNLEVLSNGIVSANVKSSYIHLNIGGLTFGQGHLPDSAAGLLLEGSRSESFKERKSEKILSAKNKLKEGLIGSFLQLLQHFISSIEHGAKIDAEAFRETCLRSAAFIVSELELHKNGGMIEGFSQLVRLLCWCPAYICSPEAMGTGVFIWTWLVSAAPHLSSLLLAELVDAWLWSIETGRGLFASGPGNSGPNGKLRPHLSPGGPVSSGDRDPVEGIKAHRIWLGFFFDRFEVVRHDSLDQLSLIGRLLQGSLKRPNHFSSHPAATGTLFSLMLLGLKFSSCRLQARQAKGVDIWLLEDRIHWLPVYVRGYHERLILLDETCGTNIKAL